MTINIKGCGEKETTTTTVTKTVKTTKTTAAGTTTTETVTKRPSFSTTSKLSEFCNLLNGLSLPDLITDDVISFNNASFPLSLFRTQTVSIQSPSQFKMTFDFSKNIYQPTPYITKFFIGQNVKSVRAVLNAGSFINQSILTSDNTGIFRYEIFNNVSSVTFDNFTTLTENAELLLSMKIYGCFESSECVIDGRTYSHNQQIGVTSVTKCVDNRCWCSHREKVCSYTNRTICRNCTENQKIDYDLNGCCGCNGNMNTTSICYINYYCHQDCKNCQNLPTIVKKITPPEKCNCAPGFAQISKEYVDKTELICYSSKMTIENCNPETTTQKVTQTTSGILTTTTTPGTPQITTVRPPAYCTETITEISTKEYVKEIVVSSNVNDKEKVITKGWLSEITDKSPQVEFIFKKTVTVERVVLTNIGNIASYSVLVIYENKTNWETLINNNPYDLESMNITIDRLNVRVTNMKFSFIKMEKKEGVLVYTIILGCGEKESLSITHTRPVSSTSTKLESTTSTHLTSTKSLACTDNETEIVSKQEYLKEILVSSNVKDAVKVVTYRWISDSKDKSPTVELIFKKSVTVTKVVLTNLGNIQKYSVEVTLEGNNYFTSLINNKSYNMESENITISGLNVRITNIKFTFTTLDKNEGVMLRIIVLGCGEKGFATTTATKSTISSTSLPTSFSWYTTTRSSTTQSIETTSPFFKTTSISSTSKKFTTTPSFFTTSSKKCTDSIAEMFSNEYFKEVLVSSNSENAYEIITHKWISNSTDLTPTVRFRFWKPAIVTRIMLRTPVNLAAYESTGMEVISNKLISLANSSVRTPESTEMIEIQDEKTISEISFRFRKTSTLKALEVRIIISGCGEKGGSTTKKIPTTTEAPRTVPLTTNATLSFNRTTTMTPEKTTTTRQWQKLNCSFVVTSNNTIIKDKCVSEQPIIQGYCSGGCPSKMQVDPFNGTMDAKCHCCRPNTFVQQYMFKCGTERHAINVFVVSGCTCSLCESVPVKACEIMP